LLVELPAISVMHLSLVEGDLSTREDPEAKIEEAEIIEGEGGMTAIATGGLMTEVDLIELLQLQEKCVW